MKLTIPIEELQKKLAFVNHAISSRSQLPILLHVLVETRDGKLSISSTDLEVGIQTTVPATIEEEGGTTVPARTFSELISSLTEKEVTLETKDTILHVVTKRTKSVFQTIAREEFPKLYEEKGQLVSTLGTESLQNDFSAIIFAASTDTARPALSGVLVKKEEGGFLLVATDGYRLSLRHSKTKPSESEDLAVMIVPARVFREVLGVKGVKTVGVYVAREKNQVFFDLGDTEVVGRLIEAEFPNYERIIPTEHSLRTAFDREELLKAAKICSIFARDSANIIKLSLKKDMIVVSSQTPSLGENTVEVEAKLEGEENEIAFNARYLLDILSNVIVDDLTFEMTGPLNPGVFRIKDDPSFLHLIMPIRIQS